MQKMGIWPFTYTSLEEFNKYVITFFLEIFVFILLWGEFNQLLEYVDISLFVEGICVFLTALMSPIKNIIVLINRKKLQEIFILVNDLYVNTPIKEDKRLRSNLNQAKKTIHIYFKSFYFLSVSILVLYDLLPIVKYFSKGEIVFQSPSKFPIDMNNFAQFFVFYLAELIAGFRVISMFTGDILFAAFITFTCTRIDLLLESVKLSIKETRKYKRTTKIFKDSIVYQSKIMR